MSTYGTLFIDRAKFAIETKYIQEVTLCTNSFTPLSVTPAYIIGTTNLRGLCLPILDIRQLLELESDGSKGNKFVILNKNGITFGISATEAGRIMKILDDALISNETAGDTGIVNELFLDNKQEKIKVLDLDALFNVIDISQLTKYVENTSAHNDLLDCEQIDKCISFSFENHKFTVPLLSVRELVRAERLEKCNFKDKFCSGRFTIRGNNMPVINPSTISEIADVNTIVMDVEHMLVIIKENGKYAAFCADRIIGIVAHSRNSSQRDSGELTESIITDDVEYTYLNVPAIFASPAIMALTHKYHLIFGLQNLEGFKKDASARNLFLAFKACYTFAFNIEQILGIVEFDSSVQMSTHNKNPYIANMMLRGKTTKIIDFSVLYGLPTSDSHERVIIIIRDEEDQYGFLVEKLKTVLNITKRNKIHVHELLRPEIEPHCWDDVHEIVQVDPDIAHAEQILIINIDKALQRVRLYES